MYAIRSYYVVKVNGDNGVELSGFNKIENEDRLASSRYEKKETSNYEAKRGFSDVIDSGETNFYRAKISYLPQTDA